MSARRKTHCCRGHPLSGPNIYVRPDTKAHVCRICQRLRQRAYKRRKAFGPLREAWTKRNGRRVASAPNT